MSQSTHVINDGSGSSVLTQLNAALQALASGNSGAVAPGTTYPLQLWADTTTNLWKIRNKANTAWITLGALDATDGLVGTFDAAKLVANSIALSKIARGTLNKVLLAQGAGADPIWGDPVFDASALVAGSVTADKLAAGIIRGKVQSIFSNSVNETQYWCAAIGDGGVLKFVGQNVNGVFGCGMTLNSDSWVDARFNVPNTSGIKKVVYGMSSVIVLFNDGKVYSCGNNGYGQLGLGDTTNRRVFTRIEYFVTNNITVSDIFYRGDRYRSYEGAYFLSSTGSLYACGYNGNGELGVGDTANRSTPTLISGSIASISKVIGSQHSAFLLTSTGFLYATGYNGYGQLGLGDTTNRSAFTLVSNLSGVADITFQDQRYDSTDWTPVNSAYVRLTNGDAYSTGYNAWGQLGLGDTTQRNSFTKITALANVAGILPVGGGGQGVTAAWTTSGVLYTFGIANDGAVGNGASSGIVLTPWQVVGWAENTTAAPPFQGKIQQVLPLGSALGYAGFAVLDTDGNVWHTGRDDWGNGGTGTQTTNSRFTRVKMPVLNTNEKITSLAVMGYENNKNMLMLSNQGRLFITGYNGYGQCGGLNVRSTSNLYTPQPVNF